MQIWVLFMHEFSTAQQIVRTVMRVAMQNNVKVIKEINIELGRFTFVNPDQLRFVFKIAAEPYELLNDVYLNITIVEGEITCKDCGYKGPLKNLEELEDNPELHKFAINFVLDCPKCNGKNTEITSGRQLLVKNIKVD